MHIYNTMHTHMHVHETVGTSTTTRMTKVDGNSFGVKLLACPRSTKLKMEHDAD